MILVDFSNILFKCVHVDIGKKELDIIDLRHLLLSQIRMVKKKFHKDYGRVVICFDGQKNWRYDIFPHYKGKRKKKRQESKVDYDAIFKMAREIENEWREFMPFQCLRVNECEADDIIAYIAMKYSNERHMICSSDSDMKQLMRNPNIRVFSLQTNKLVKMDEPLEKWLFRGVCKGQGGKDGVPNIYSEANHYMIDDTPKQKAISEVKIEEWFKHHKKPELWCESPEMLQRFKDNLTLIDFREIPAHIKELIAEDIKQPYEMTNKKIYKYFTLYDLQSMMRDIEHFFED